MPPSVVLSIVLTVVLAEGTSQLVENQQKMARSLRLLDRIGITLTVATAVRGLGLAATYLYVGLNNTTAGM
jgi:hypothetical protein